MRRIQPLLFFGLLFFGSPLLAQINNSYFTILVGTFSGNRPENYTAIEKLGFLFAKERPNQVFDVYVGGYDTALDAAKILDQVKKAGFTAAKIQQYVVRDNQAVTSIQIASFDTMAPINWSQYQQLYGELFVIPNDNGAKLLTGFHPNIEAARKELLRVQAMGFADAFVRTVHPTFLHQVGGFETGNKPKDISATAHIGPKKTNVNVAKPELRPQPTFLPVDYQLNSANTNPAVTPGVSDNRTGYAAVPPVKTNERTAPGGNGQTQFKWDTPGANTSAKTPTQVPPSYEASNSSNNLSSNYNYNNASGVKGGNVPPVTTTQSNNFNQGNLNGTPVPIYRASVKELQLALVQEGAFRGSVDGYYNAATEQAYGFFQERNRLMTRYMAIAQLKGDPNMTESMRVSKMINHLDQDANPNGSLAAVNHPLSKAYLAYLSFSTRGAGYETNNLMNGAIREVFSSRNVSNQISFDSRAVYVYTDMRQFILHLYYLHAALGQEYPLPCWLNEKYPQESAEAQGLFNASSSLPLPTQSCFNQVPDQQSTQVLQLLAEDIGVEKPAETLLKQANEHRVQLYAGKIQLSPTAQTQLDNWSTELMNKLNVWSAQDPLHAELVRAFQVVFYQTQLQLENHYVAQGMSVPQARYLALATQHTLVSPYLQRFE